LTDILPSCGWVQGQVTWGKMAKNLPSLRCGSQKNRNPKQKNFFHCRLNVLLSLLRVWTAL